MSNEKNLTAPGSTEVVRCESIKDIKPYMDNKYKVNIVCDQVVLGYDEWDKKFVEVRYRRDSNIFFEEPYTGAFYPKFRMHRFKHLTEHD